MTQDELILMARLSANTQGLDPALVCALVEQESGWRPNATRFEQGFYDRYIVPLNCSEPEGSYRATSYGLMQIMGEVAREFGFTADIPTLCDPYTGLLWGCKVLAHYIAEHAGNVTLGLLRYNGGGNPNYASEVLARMPKYQTSVMSVDDSTQI